jgi:hypothetical protein
MPKGIVLLEPEPVGSFVATWLAWLISVVILMMVLIHFSNYFARGNECFVVNEYHTGIPTADIRNAKWRRRFEQVDRRGWVSTTM